MRRGFWVPLLITSTLAVGCDPFSLLKEATGQASPAATSSAASVAPAESAAAAPASSVTSAGAVSVGRTVMALEVDETEARQVRVIELYGKLAKVQYPRGQHHWVYLSKMTPAGTPLPDPQGHSCTVMVGQRVKMLWPFDGKKYSARVGEVYGRMARVVFQDSGSIRWAACESLDPVF